MEKMWVITCMTFSSIVVCKIHISCVCHIRSAEHSMSKSYSHSTCYCQSLARSLVPKFSISILTIVINTPSFLAFLPSPKLAMVPKPLKLLKLYWDRLL